MGALTFDALLRSLKQGAPDPVYYLHGEEDVLKDEAVRALLDHGTAEPPDAELVRRATAVEVTALPPERVERWMTHRAKQLGFTLAPEAGELLLASVGNDLSGLARELEKLAPLCAGRPATRDEVAALVGVRRGETLQDFVDATLERRARHCPRRHSARPSRDRPRRAATRSPRGCVAVASPSRATVRPRELGTDR